MTVPMNPIPVPDNIKTGYLDSVLGPRCLDLDSAIEDPGLGTVTRFRIRYDILYSKLILVYSQYREDLQ